MFASPAKEKKGTTAKSQPKRPATSVPLAQVASLPFQTSSNSPLIARKATCACGGGCPRCENESRIRFQAKLKISTPGDQFEQEADRVADQVMRMAAPAADSYTNTQGPTIQRKCAQCEDDEHVQKKESSGSGFKGPADSHHASTVMRKVLGSSGQPLDNATRDFMESRFTHDFGNVRIHTDSAAADAARSVNALAFTAGRNVIFGPQQYAPHTTEGKRLLAHELTHVVQQGAAGARSLPGVSRSSQKVQRSEDPSDFGITSVSNLISASPPAIQRACLPAGIGTPAGCITQAPVHVDGYSSFEFESDCDDFVAGEEAKLITAATALPATAEFEVHGYATTAGNAAFNQNLACARALKANVALTTGASIPAARIKGVFSHGPTPGPGSRKTVVISPPRATPLPTTRPAAGATDFLIERVGTSTGERIFFARGSSTLDSPARAQILNLRLTPPGTVRVIGYASADEAATVALDRAKEVEKALSAPASSGSPKALGAPMDFPLTVSSATGNAPATAGRTSYTSARYAEIIVGAAAAATKDCDAPDPADPEPDPAKKRKLHPARQPCSVMDADTETAFKAAQPIAFDAMKRAEAIVAGTPTSDDEKLIDRFFGNHDTGTIDALKTNLKNLKDHVDRLPSITDCGGECDTGKCEKGNVIAYNNDVDLASTMTLCVPFFKSMKFNDQVRNLIHESAHGTTPLGGPLAPSEGTKDVAYRHERMLFELSPADRLRNSDSYALYALFVRETQIKSDITAEPKDIKTPSKDTMPGFGTDAPALKLAIAQLEKRLSWAEDWGSQLYGTVVEIRKGKTDWASEGWAAGLMRQAAKRFPLGGPTGTPTLTDQTRLASIVERYSRMKSGVKRNLNFSRMASGVVKWASVSTEWIVGDKIEIGPDFFRATPEDQVALLFENLALATKDVEPAFVPAYLTFAEWLHSQNK